MISKIAVRRGPETVLYSREAGSEDQGLDTAGVGGIEAKRKHAHDEGNEKTKKTIASKIVSDNMNETKHVSIIRIRICASNRSRWCGPTTYRLEAIRYESNKKSQRLIDSKQYATNRIKKSM